VEQALRSGEISPKSPSSSTKGNSALIRRIHTTGRSLIQFLSEICNLRISFFDSSNRLKDVSATGWLQHQKGVNLLTLDIVQQLDVRLEQFSFFPSQIELISTRSRRDIANYSAQYIKYVSVMIPSAQFHLLSEYSFYNNIWLIFNDVVVGTAVGTILCENHEHFGYLLHEYIKVLLLRSQGPQSWNTNRYGPSKTSTIPWSG
jgi:hypothetical protein